jgi:hypothetical protein
MAQIGQGGFLHLSNSMPINVSTIQRYLVRATDRIVK